MTDYELYRFWRRVVEVAGIVLLVVTVGTTVSYVTKVKELARGGYQSGEWIKCR